MGLGCQLAQRHFSALKGFALSTESGISQTGATIWTLGKITTGETVTLAHARLTTITHAFAGSA